MSIEVAGRTIVTDAEGFLVNADDWSEEVAAAMAAEQSEQDRVELSETQLGLIQYFRDHFAETKVHPTMHKLVMTLGKHHGQHFHDHKEYEKFLYDMFPKGPVAELCKLAGLPKPTEDMAG